MGNWNHKIIGRGGRTGLNAFTRIENKIFRFGMKIKEGVIKHDFFSPYDLCAVAEAALFDESDSKNQETGV